MEIAVADEVQVEEFTYPTRPGKTRMQRMLMVGAADGFSFRLLRSQYQGGDDAFQTPRHHHAFQQIRFAEKGSLNYAPDQNVDDGEIAYFPRGTYYGPQVRDKGIGLTIQFGFGNEMLGGKDALEVYRQGVKKLRELGEVGNGVFIDTDPETGKERVRDTWAAVVELMTGEKFEIPPGRYEAPILMRPGNYAYYQASPGVEVKHLGGFYDHPGPNADVRMSVVRLSPGGVFRLSSDRAQLAWTTDTGLQAGGRTLPGLTALFSPRGEEAELGSAEIIELFLVEFPRLD